jgi:nicotinate phosphoribosyltransferase
MSCDNLTLHTDKYQINMMYAHWTQGTMNDRAVFELMFRKLPFGNGYAVFAGLERVVTYIQSLHFGDEEIAYLRTQEEQYKEEFLQELRSFRFTGNLDAVIEGTMYSLRNHSFVLRLECSKHSSLRQRCLIL